tara:strand:- start:2691 stop:3434 length:744 start_codon:yes stop_codon:yes gene_type:complete
MVNIDTVYQTVLAIANKEQRGYIPPREFDLFAEQVQLEIFDQYFYDYDMFRRAPGTDNEYADKLTNLNEKITLFEQRNIEVDIHNQFGDIRLAEQLPDLYRIGQIKVQYASQPSRERYAEYMEHHELERYEQSSLTKARKNKPMYILTRGATTMPQRLKIYPYPKDSGDKVYVTYLKRPEKPHWGYVVVNEKPLYNASTSTHFWLHISEQSELIYRILQLAGISIQRPLLTQSATMLKQAKQNNEKL